jgi:tyrosyl-tRNA synthetase
VQKGQEKMSKSDPTSAIFMEDSEADVNAKIKTCWAPPCELEKNPLIDCMTAPFHPHRHIHTASLFHSLSLPPLSLSLEVKILLDVVR